MPPPPAAVLLDLYDTLVWTEWPELRQRLMSRLGVEPRALMRAFDQTRPARSVGTYPDATGDMAALLGALGITDAATVDELAALERTYFAERPRVHLHQDSLPTIRALRAGGTKIAMVSNCSHLTRAEVERLGLDEELDAVILSFEVGSMKPDPEIYNAALDALGVSPAVAVFVDDQARYCDGARDLGIETRLIVRDPSRRHMGSVPDANGHQVITTLADLLDRS